MKPFFLLLALLVACSLQAQRTDRQCESYDILEITLTHGFYYKIQEPIPPMNAPGLQLFPIQILIENRSIGALDKYSFYLKVLQDGQEVTIPVPAMMLPIGTTRSHTLVIEARQRPIVIMGASTYKK